MKIFKSKSFNLFILFLFLSTNIFIFSDNSNAVSPSPSNSYGLINSTYGKNTRSDSFKLFNSFQISKIIDNALFHKEYQNFLNNSSSYIYTNYSGKIFKKLNESKAKNFINLTIKKYNFKDIEMEELSKYTYLYHRLNINEEKNHIISNYSLNKSRSIDFKNNIFTRGEDSAKGNESNIYQLFLQPDADTYNFLIKTDISFTLTDRCKIYITMTMNQQTYKEITTFGVYQNKLYIFNNNPFSFKLYKAYSYYIYISKGYGELPSIDIYSYLKNYVNLMKVTQVKK